MGGYGSGQTGWKPKSEYSHKVDVRKLHRKGLLTAGKSFSWSWHRGDEHTGSISIVIWPEKVSFHYSIKQYNSEERVQMHEHLPLTWTDCHYGGQRPWFLCPRCSRRIAIVYLRSQHFYCRNCQKMTYASRCESTTDRLWRKERKLRKRLSYDGTESGEILFKQKGMHQKTFDRLWAEYKRKDHKLAYQIAVQFGVRMW